MKKSLLSLILAFALAGCFGIMGCSSEEPAESGDAAAAEEAAAEEATPAEEEAPETDYPITIDDAVVTKDFEGKSALVVTYTWTNNGEDAQMFETVYSAKAFQNGIQLDYGTLGMDEEEKYDVYASMNEIKPGTTQTVNQVYLLDDKSEVSVEVTEWISFDEAILAERTFKVAK